MYKSKIFISTYELTEFLNSNNIDKEDIVSIFDYQGRVALIWIDKE